MAKRSKTTTAAPIRTPLELATTNAQIAEMIVGHQYHAISETAREWASRLEATAARLRRMAERDCTGRAFSVVSEMQCEIAGLSGSLQANNLVSSLERIVKAEAELAAARAELAALQAAAAETPAAE
jgi:hypothetical protein